jgi:hypothetical protein
MSRVRNKRGGEGAAEGEAGETLIHDGDKFVGPLTVAVRSDHLRSGMGRKKDGRK